MTEHTGLPVAGYRPQSTDKVELVNLGANKGKLYPHYASKRQLTRVNHAG